MTPHPARNRREAPSVARSTRRHAAQSPGPVDELDEDEDPDLSFIDEMRKVDDPDRLGDDPTDESGDPEERRSGESPDDDRDLEPEPHPRP